ncbi:Fatty acid desaturase [Xylophilus ampelinus]|uniref:Fatty acid desaturase domain-containing protein n=1 Tax=Variovorax paradoxus TaxID=34073 RepID=A0A2W5QMC3_VARPD|nr:MAG: hypothetical protein DI563_00060 [Variovorax paradoxus]VTY30061.1 Fatty acid desaturase [Xylophilus ampelinus]
MMHGVTVLLAGALLLWAGQAIPSRRYRAVLAQDWTHRLFRTMEDADSLRVLQARLRVRGDAYVLAVAAFGGNWLVVAGCCMLAEGAPLAYFPLLAALAAGRFRSLQELAHFAAHGALTQSRRIGEGLADLFSQYPLLLVDVRRWSQMHCGAHHPLVGSERDPVFATLDHLRGKLAASRSPGSRIVKLVFAPLGPAGVGVRMREILEVTASRQIALRLAAFALLWTLGGSWEGRVVLLIALVLWLPWFAWISLLNEHCWFAADDDSSGFERDLAYGKRTYFLGIAGVLSRIFIFPVGDTYHLAHSLVPTVPHQALSHVDALLCRSWPKYSSVPVRHSVFFPWCGSATIYDLNGASLAANHDP